MDTTTQVITILIILLALVVTVVATQFIRRRKGALTLRPIPSYDALPMMVGAAVEADRPVHFSLGGTGIGGGNTLLTLANAEMFYQMAHRAATGTTAPIVTTSDTSTLPLTYNLLYRAYASRNRVSRFKSSSNRWYPAGPRSLAFAAALTATIGDDRVSGNILVGSFGSELALVLDAAARRKQGTIAASAQLDGQAIAYALSDRPLIGEEMFVAGAYLGDSATQRGSVAAIDVLRWLLIAGILIATINTIREPVAEAIGRLLGGG